MLTALCFLFVVADSCTYDYFVDETNFRLHVPQIERGEISNIYVAFHDEEGNHIFTRRVPAPFDMIEEGIMKFKIFPGNYSISVFADYDDEMMIENRHFSESYKSARLFDGFANTYSPSQSQPRALFMRDVTIYPMGHPESKTVVEADIDELHRFKGTIVCRFRDMPTGSITRIVTTYKGPSTRLDFDGAFRRFDPADVYRHEFPTAENSQQGEVVCTSTVYPSTGETYDDVLSLSPVSGGEEIEFKIDFYNGDTWAGGTTLTKDDLAALDDESKPVDGDGNRVEDLVLRPRKTIALLFKGFTLVGVGLEPWGPAEDGDFDIH